MKKSIWFIRLMIIFMIFTPLYGLVVRSDDAVMVNPDEIINDDFICMGQDIDIKGKIYGDVYAFGQDVTISGDVYGTIVCGAARVDIKGQYINTIWVGAGNINVAARVKNNVLIFGGTFDLGQDSDIGNDLVCYSGKARIGGTINGTIKGSMGNLVMSGKTSCINVDAEEITIKSNAEINGDLIIESGTKPVIEEGAVIKGETKLKKPEEKDSENIAFAIAPLIAFLLTVVKILIFVTKIIVGIVLIAVSRRYLRRIMDALVNKPWISLGWGFLGLIGIPVIFAVLLAVIIGYPLAVLAAYVYTIMLYLASIVVGLVIGEKLIRLFKKEGDISLYASFILGAVLLFVLGLIPILGFIINLIVVLFGSGALLVGSWYLIREMRAQELL